MFDEDKQLVGFQSGSKRQYSSYMYKTDCIPDIERDFQETLNQCMQVTEESIQGTETFYKIMGPVAKLIAPLM